MGPTLKQANEIVAPRLKEIIKTAPRELIKRTKSESKWIIGTSELVIGGFDINSTSQRGKTVQTIYIEEVVDSKPDQYTESMREDLGPALTHSDGGKMIFLTTPPKIPHHPFIVETMAKAKLNNALFTYTIDDNKALSQEQYDKCVSRCGGKDTVAFRREYKCEIVRDESVTVIPAFNSMLHVKQFDLPTFSNFEEVIDWGGVKDKTVCLLYTYDYLANKMLVFDERVFPANTSTSIITEKIRDMEASYNGMVIAYRWADVPGQLQVDLQDDNFPVVLPSKSDWKAAINNLQVGFCNNEIIVHKDCKFLITTLESGQFNDQKTDFLRTATIGHCDAIAALMYGYRMCSKENPYGKKMPSRDSQFVRHQKTEDEVLSEAIQPKTFSTNFNNGFKPKRFGAFKNG